MTVLGAGRGPSLLGSVTLSLDEMQYLQETLGIDELPVVLNALGRYDNAADHDAAMVDAAAMLAERELLDGDPAAAGHEGDRSSGTAPTSPYPSQVHPELSERLLTLYRPHWVLALRWYVEGQVNRFCVAKGDDIDVVALRGPGSYVVDEASHDLPGTVLAALGPADPLELSGMHAPTEDLVPIFDDAGDAATTAARLSTVCDPARDAQAIASALVQVHSHAEIVGVRYGDGVREVAGNHLAVYNTRHGRFLAITTTAEDGTEWTSFASGTPARLRRALLDLVESLPLRAEFGA
ncbi:ESX secretion-associated protein EspG [Nocardia sp. NPDC059764]|uniref:ESX secretion-associated protein EspG n=1 Tax=Nocardia sp. NPDC059764 TaxID=3346939 RepID=UPI0036663CAF